MIAGHTHRHSWLAPPFSGYRFPILTNGTKNYVQIEANQQALSIKVISDQDVVVMSKQLKKE
jgi:hypothetical protein